MGVDEIRDHLRQCQIVALDTVVFSYHFHNHPDYAPLTSVILGAIETGQVQGITTTITLAEVLVKPEQEGNAQAAADYEIHITLFPNLALLPVDVSLARLAAKLRARYGLKMPDAIQVAGAKLGEADALITNDREWKRKIKDMAVLLLMDYL